MRSNLLWLFIISSALVASTPDNIELKKPEIGNKAVNNTSEKKQDLKKIRFVLKKVIINYKGNLDKNKMLSFFTGHYNKNISVYDFTKLLNQLNIYFLKQGYILTRAYIPPHKANNGIVKLNVLAGHVNLLKISGDVPEDIKSRVTYLMQPVLREKPLKSQTLENALLRARRIPGLEVSSILSPRKDKSKGATVLTVLTKLNSSSIFLGTDNYLNKLGGSLKLSSGITNYSLAPGSRFSVNASQSVNPNHVSSITFSASVPLGYNGDFGNATFSSSKSKPNYKAIGIDTLNSISNSKFLNLNYTHPLVITRLYSNVMTLNWYRNHSILNGEQSAFDDLIKGITFGVNWQFLGVKNTQNNLNLTLTNGTGSIGNSSRTSADSNFNKFNVNFSSSKLLNARLQALVSISAQTTHNILKASEEFVFGGQNCGIGYDSGDMMGDQGYCFHKQINIILPEAKKFGLKNWVAFAFHDNGAIRNNDTTQKKRDNAQSFGIGLNLGFNKNASAKLVYGLPLNHKVQLEDNYKGRLFFTVSYRN